MPYGVAISKGESTETTVRRVQGRFPPPRGPTVSGPIQDTCLFVTSSPKSAAQQKKYYLSAATIFFDDLGIHYIRFFQIQSAVCNSLSQKTKKITSPLIYSIECCTDEYFEARS